VIVSTKDEAAPPAVGALDVDRLSSRLKVRRGKSGQSVRQAANEAGVSFMTFTRVESGSQPDLATFLKLCAWLRTQPEQFFLSGARRPSNTPEEVAAHLATDPRLDAAAAKQIASVVRDMYDVLAKNMPPNATPVACHLRAASVLRPGVAGRLGSVLSDMHDELVARHDAGDL
jgi:transcriptional regulator with XRE-family HTH domain